MRACTLSFFAHVLISLMTATGYGAWEVVLDTAGARNLMGVHFADANHGIAWGQGGTRIIWSDDGGRTWHPATTPKTLNEKVKGYAFFVYDAQMLNARVGYALAMRHSTGRGLLLRSGDGGRTWSVVSNLREIGGARPMRIWFANEERGWIIPLVGHRLFKTTDASKTLHAIGIANAHPAIRASVHWRHGALHAFSFQHILLGCDGPMVIATRDGGASWSAVELAQMDRRFFVADIDFCNAKHGWLVGFESGRIPHKGNFAYRTTDGGASWIRVRLPCENYLRSVDCLSADEVYIAGWHIGVTATVDVPGVLLHTTDGGKTWRNENPTLCPLECVFFLDRKHGWAVGGKGGMGNLPSAIILRFR